MSSLKKERNVSFGEHVATVIWFCFIGWTMKAIKTLKQLTARFPDDVRIWNDYGVSNLIANRIEDAREAFRKVSVPTS